MKRFFDTVKPADRSQVELKENKKDISQFNVELSKLRYDLCTLFFELNKDPIYTKELDHHYHPKNKADHFRSPIFNQKILNPLAAFNETYQKIKQDLIKYNYITAPELEIIEASVLETEKENLNNLLYFPAFQSVYNEELTSYNNQTKEHKKCLENKRDILKNNYNNRCNSYHSYEATFGYMSIGALGVPFLMVTLLIHGIDKLITSLKLSKHNKAIQKDGKKILSNTLPEESHARYKEKLKDPSTLLRQSIFEFKKAQKIGLPDPGFANKTLTLT